ncbi:hypothetical protein ACVIJW_010070 [Bradyrhizobium barranii subsp. barranii]
MPSSRFSGRYRRGNSAVGWARVRSSRAVPTVPLSTRVEKVGAPPPSLFELRRTSRFVPLYDFAPVGRSKSPGYGHLKLPHLMIAVSAAEQQ